MIAFFPILLGLATVIDSSSVDLDFNLFIINLSSDIDHRFSSN